MGGGHVDQPLALVLAAEQQFQGLGRILEAVNDVGAASEFAALVQTLEDGIAGTHIWLRRLQYRLPGTRAPWQSGPQWTRSPLRPPSEGFATIQD